MCGCLMVPQRRLGLKAHEAPSSRACILVEVPEGRRARHWQTFASGDESPLGQNQLETPVLGQRSSTLAPRLMLRAQAGGSEVVHFGGRDSCERYHGNDDLRPDARRCAIAESNGGSRDRRFLVRRRPPKGCRDRS